MGMKLVRCILDKPWIKKGETCLFMGEIENMKGHGIYADTDGKVHYAYHMEDFEIIPEEET